MAKGRSVLYFCLEQTKLNYYFRSLARLFFMTHLKEALEKSRVLGFPAKYGYYYHDAFSGYPTPSGMKIQRSGGVSQGARLPGRSLYKYYRKSRLRGTGRLRRHRNAPCCWHRMNRTAE